MKIDLNKILAERIVEPLDLGEYHAQFAGQMLQVWVNPPLATRQRYAGIRREAEEIRKEVAEEVKAPSTALPPVAPLRADRDERAGRLLTEQAAWLSEIWSQGPEDTRMTAEEVERLRSESQETNPRLFAWLISRTIHMMAEHLGIVKNA
jgi:hypothetical protein